MQEKKTVYAREIDFMALFNGVTAARDVAHTTGTPQAVKLSDYATREYYTDGTAADVQPVQNNVEMGENENDN